MGFSKSDLFLVVCQSFLVTSIIGIGYAAVLPELSQTTTQTSSQHPLVGEGIRVAYVKTDFSCVGRPSGYYADVETGCELYHMCDGLGRKFSYACPNTTLFQQRMLICDHWYMVNCSKAERDYSANLLIGQRDKPFVSEGENELRTPRPDLKDRPYSADYSGESFRRHYQHHNVPAGNAIGSESSNVPEYAPIHWETSNRQAINNPTTESITAESAKTINGLLIFNTPAGFSKPEIVKSIDVSDKIEIPSIIFELPNTHPDYTKLQQTSTEPIVTPSSPPPPAAASASGTPKRVNHLSPSAFAKAFEPNSNQFNLQPKEYEFSKQFKLKSPSIAPKKSVVADQTALPTTNIPATPLPPQTTSPIPTTTTSTTTTTERAPVPSIVQNDLHYQQPTRLHNAIPEPIDGLQPPHTYFKTYDDSTTEGPPIYYQWKWAIPAFVLEPPKLNDPVAKQTKAENPHTARSIGERTTANAENESAVKYNQDFFKKPIKHPEHNYLELKKSLSIPSFDFPLEADGRSGLSNADALNSYQLKIPAIVNTDQSWYGENKECPECHPAFLQPGTCEPCIKR